jgi:chromosome partitioning protein
VFKVADRIIVPVIPTTLSERTFDQLQNFFKDHNFKKKKLVPFFSMVQQTKKLHKETILRMRQQYKGFLNTAIPFSTDIEKMGIHRAPVVTYARSRSATKAYSQLWNELQNRL